MGTKWNTKPIDLRLPKEIKLSLRVPVFWLFDCVCNRSKYDLNIITMWICNRKVLLRTDIDRGRLGHQLQSVHDAVRTALTEIYQVTNIAVLQHCKYYKQVFLHQWTMQRAFWNLTLNELSQIYMHSRFMLLNSLWLFILVNTTSQET